MVKLGRCAPIAAVALAALGFSAGVRAHGYKKSNLEIVHPWAFETTGSTVYVSMKIAAKDGESDRLVAASSPIAEGAVVALSASEGRAEVANEGLVVPGGGELVLSRNGAHIELDGLKKPLIAYGTFPLHLVFERAGPMDIEVMIEEAEESEPAR